MDWARTAAIITLGLPLFCAVIVLIMYRIFEGFWPRGFFYYFMAWWWPHRPYDAGRVLAATMDALPEQFKCEWGWDSTDNRIVGPNNIVVYIKPPFSLAQIKLPGAKEYAPISAYSDYLIYRFWKKHVKVAKRIRAKEEIAEIDRRRIAHTVLAIKELKPLLEEQKNDRFS